jgi:6-phosphogluconolactonase
MTQAMSRVALYAAVGPELTHYAIDPLLGEPVWVQSIDAAGIHCRTLHIDPSGRHPVAAHAVGAGRGPGCLSLFCIADDRTLSLLRKYDVEVGARQLFWIGMVEHSAAR